MRTIEDVLENIRTIGVDNFQSESAVEVLDAYISEIISIHQAEQDSIKQVRSDIITNKAFSENKENKEDVDCGMLLGLKVALDSLDRHTNIDIESDKTCKKHRPAHRRNDWIYLNDDKPKKSGEYLVKWTTSVAKKAFVKILECDIIHIYDKEEDDNFNIEWILDDSMKSYPDVKVVAWQELPEA